MLRPLYRCVLRLHPSGFRTRFADEMLSIFDHASGNAATVRLLADGLISLLRQWALRPEFRHEFSPALQPVPHGVPSFHTLDPFRPRAGAVIHGLVLSTVVFCMTCFAIRYSWIHVLHLRIPEVVFDSPQSLRTNPVARESFQGPVVPPRPETRTEETLPAPPPAGRSPNGVQARAAASPLMVKNGAETSTASASPAVTQAPAQLIVATAVAPAILQSYAGKYVFDSPDNLAIMISEESGHLVMTIAGQPKRKLVPVSETEFIVKEIEGGWIVFSRSDANSDRNHLSHWELHLFQNGEQFTARRQ
jgi:hypothetical protein